MAAGSVAGSAVADKTNMTNGANINTGYDNSGWSLNLSTHGGSATQTTSSDKSSSDLGLSQLLKNPVLLVLLAFVAYTMVTKK